LYGIAITPGLESFCRFGTGLNDIDNRSIVVAIVVSSTHVTCISPTTAEGVQGKQPIYFSVNGVHFQPTGRSFRYVAEPVILSISPSIGPDSGGSKVSIKGLHLGSRSSVTMCEFASTLTATKNNKYRVAAVWIHNELTCISPAQQPGLVTVRISSNGQQYR
jgi:hypothetical protein